MGSPLKATSMTRPHLLAQPGFDAFKKLGFGPKLGGGWSDRGQFPNLGFGPNLEKGSD